MATITGYTAEKMDEIVDGIIENGSIDGNGHLILVKHDLTEIDVGSVIGPQGDQGPTGVTSIAIVTSVTRPTGGALFIGLFIWETDTKFLYVWDGTAWVYRGGRFVCTSTTRPTSPFDGLAIYETDTKRDYVWDGTAWVQRSGPALWVVPTFLNSWINFGGAMQTARYCKINGVVYIEGNVKSGTSMTPIFQLPAGFRPGATLSFAQVGAGSFNVMDIKANGDVVPGITGNAAFSIVGSFKASA